MPIGTYGGVRGEGKPPLLDLSKHYAAELWFYNKCWGRDLENTPDLFFHAKRKNSRA